MDFGNRTPPAGLHKTSVARTWRVTAADPCHAGGAASCLVHIGQPAWPAVVTMRLLEHGKKARPGAAHQTRRITDLSKERAARLSYGTVTVAGRHRLEVALNGAPVVGSPLQLDVASAEACPASCSYVGMGRGARLGHTCAGAAGEPILFRLRLRDRFGNRCDAFRSIEAAHAAVVETELVRSGDAGSTEASGGPVDYLEPPAELRAGLVPECCAVSADLNAPGELIVSLVRQRAGVHSVAVWLAGEKLGGEFCSHVNAAAAHPPSCGAEGSVACIARHEAEIELVARDEFGNVRRGATDGWELVATPPHTGTDGACATGESAAATGRTPGLDASTGPVRLLGGAGDSGGGAGAALFKWALELRDDGRAVARFTVGTAGILPVAVSFKGATVRRSPLLLRAAPPVLGLDARRIVAGERFTFWVALAPVHAPPGSDVVLAAVRALELRAVDEATGAEARLQVHDECGLGDAAEWDVAVESADEAARETLLRERVALVDGGDALRLSAVEHVVRVDGGGDALQLGTVSEPASQACVRGWLRDALYARVSLVATAAGDQWSLLGSVGGREAFEGRRVPMSVFPAKPSTGHGELRAAWGHTCAAGVWYEGELYLFDVLGNQWDGQAGGAAPVELALGLRRLDGDGAWQIAPTTGAPHVLDRLDGTFLVRWRAERCGLHQLSLALNGEHMRCSHQLAIVPGAPDPLQSALTLPPRARLQPQQWNRLTAVVRDACGNAVGSLDSGRLCAHAAELRDDLVRLEPSVSTEGEYDVWVFGAARGWVNLELTVDGRHAANSPALLEVAAGGAVPSRCFGTGSGIEPKASVFCNETARFTIVACDAKAMPRSQGGDAFHVAILPRHAGTDSVVCHDSADGTYAVSWRPIVSGHYTVAITLGRVHIRNSPYHVSVGQRRGPPPFALHMRPDPGVKAAPDRWPGQTRGLRAAYEQATVAAACGGASEAVEHAKLLATVERRGRGVNPEAEQAAGVAPGVAGRGGAQRGARGERSPPLRRAAAASTPDQRAYPDVATGIAAGIAARSFNAGRGGGGVNDRIVGNNPHRGLLRAAAGAAPPPVRAAWQEAAEAAEGRGAGFDSLLAHLRRIVDDAGEEDAQRPLGQPPQGGRRGGEQAATGARPVTLIEA